jgi:hypothetical protein
MNRVMRVVDLIEKYFPADNILNKIPNFKYSNYYIINDCIMGLISSKNYNNFKSEYAHIDEHTREDIIAMNVHDSFFEKYTEKDVAHFMHNIINDL